MGPNPVTGILAGEGTGTQRARHLKEMALGRWSRGCSDVRSSERDAGTQARSGHPRAPSEPAQPAPPVHTSGRLSDETEKFCCFKPPNCGHSLWWLG